MLALCQTHSLTKLQNIGGGGYGQVYLAKLYNTQDLYAVKSNFVEKEISFIGAVRELDILTKLRDYTLSARITGLCFGNIFQGVPEVLPRTPNLKVDSLYLVCNHCEYDLHNLIHKNNANPAYIKLIMSQLLLSVEYLHAKGIVHRDLKPSNILWFRKEAYRYIKICDYGLSTYFTYQDNPDMHVITSWYRAPEIMQNQKYDYKADMWSVGCILYELVCKRPLLINTNPEKIPEVHNRLMQIMSMFPNDEISRWRNLINFSPDQIQYFESTSKTGANFNQFLDLLSKILRADPKRRFTATEALGHPFFAEYRDYIKDFRQKFPPIYDPEPILTIEQSPEREWATQTLYRFLVNRGQYWWYKNQIIFHTLEIYDRYLNYLKLNPPTLNCAANITRGKYLDQYNAELHFLTVLYLCLKYFTVDSNIFPFEKLAVSTYTSSEANKRAEEFEKFLIIDVLKYQIYHLSPLEVADSYGYTLNNQHVASLFVYYASLKTCECKPHQVFKSWFKQTFKTDVPSNIRYDEAGTMISIPTTNSYSPNTAGVLETSGANKNGVVDSPTLAKAVTQSPSQNPNVNKLVMIPTTKPEVREYIGNEDGMKTIPIGNITSRPFEMSKMVQGIQNLKIGGNTRI